MLASLDLSTDSKLNKQTNRHCKNLPFLMHLILVATRDRVDAE